MMIKPGITELDRCVDSRYTLVSVVAKRARMIGKERIAKLRELEDMAIRREREREEEKAKRELKEKEEAIPKELQTEEDKEREKEKAKEKKEREKREKEREIAEEQERQRQLEELLHLEKPVSQAVKEISNGIVSYVRSQAIEDARTYEEEKFQAISQLEHEIVTENEKLEEERAAETAAIMEDTDDDDINAVDAALAEALAREIAAGGA